MKRVSVAAAIPLIDAVYDLTTDRHGHCLRSVLGSGSLENGQIEQCLAKFDICPTCQLCAESLLSMGITARQAARRLSKRPITRRTMKGRKADIYQSDLSELSDIPASKELLEQLAELRARLTKTLRDWRRDHGLCGEGTCKNLRYKSHAYCIRHLATRREASLRFKSRQSNAGITAAKENL